jgi:Raf kinase inhibitor-like YbhB/YbcL family protein
MTLGHAVARLAGTLLRPVRAGSEKLAGEKQAGHDNLAVESSSFAPGGRIPDAYAGKDGRSPALRWRSVPPGTREIVVLVEDPDAPSPKPFVHWIVYGISPETTDLPEGLPPIATPVGQGFAQGKNSMKQDGYTGPAPPAGHGLHHYHFQVFALDSRLDLEAPVDRDRLVDAMRDHVLAAGEVVGTYERT